MRNKSLEKIIIRKRNKESLYKKVKRILGLTDQCFEKIFKIAFKDTDIDLKPYIHISDFDDKISYKLFNKS